MNIKISSGFKENLKSLVEFKKTERKWHLPVLAAFCVGVPLLSGLFMNQVANGILASISGLVVLYLPQTAIANRMTTLMICSFGFVVSFFAGLIFSFNPWVASITLGLYASVMYWITKYFRLKPPGYFFFILIASVAICMPFQPDQISAKLGIITMGTISTCMLAFIYSLITLKKYSDRTEIIIVNKSSYSNITESIITGLFIGAALMLAYCLNLTNPYWVPVSCAAVMQGSTSKHVWQRSLHRIIGTFIGIGLASALLSTHMSAISICISIVILQFIVEMLVTRHYGAAIIFVTALTIFMAEGGKTIDTQPSVSIYARFLDITIGSCIGALGGWFLYHQKLHRNMHKHLRKTKIRLTNSSKRKKTYP
ncbi:FUSC family protein [Apibacter raozihei]|uniref:FUSC family protein n=1 Tax=Apibacter raozihei TaxID=2500547 RepID=UPI000FE3FCF7|nr:FUSC family protein [Apibacter raozihei]